MNRVHSCRRAGFSLLEVVAATVVATMLLAGAAGFLSFYTRWSARANERIEQALETTLALERLHLELQEATAFYVIDPTVVEFLGPDVDGDGNQDVIRWSWSGNSGDPLVRTVSRGGMLAEQAEASPPLSDFSLEYWISREQDQATGSTRSYLVLVLAVASDTLSPEPRQYRNATVLWTRVDVTGL